MNIKLYSLVSAIIFTVAWILILMSFFKTWYYFEMTQDVSGYDNVKYEFKIGKVKTINYDNSTLNSNLNTNKFYKQFGITDLKYNEYLTASIGFAIISWIIILIQIALCLLDIVGQSSNIGKWLGIIIVIFTMLSLSIYTGFKKAVHKSCQDSNKSDCDSSVLRGLWSDSFTGDNEYSKWTYDEGWIYFVTSFVLSFAGAVYNIFLFNRREEDD